MVYRREGKRTRRRTTGNYLRRLGVGIRRADGAVLTTIILQGAARPELAQPEVKAAIFDAVRFWYDLGVDGFRLDAISTLFEEPSCPTMAQGQPGGVHKMPRNATTDEERKAILEQWETMVHSPARHSRHTRDFPGAKAIE